MQVISVPVWLRLAACALIAAVPLAAIETVLMAHAPWWRLPFHAMGLWSVVAAAIFLPLAGWLLAGRRWALSFTTVFGAFWCLLSAWAALRTRNTSLAFFTVFLSVYWVAVLSWLRFEMGRSFFDSRVGWFEDLPKPIPSLSCRTTQEGRETELRVCRLDRDGAFVFSEHERLKVEKGKPVDLVFVFREKQIRCQGKPICSLRCYAGIGFQFSDISPDTRKNLGDFVETLRGEGYV